MDDCALCSRHVPARTDENGAVTDDNCTDACRHRAPSTGSVSCAECRLRVRDDLDAITLAWLTLDGTPTLAAGSTGGGSEPPTPGGLDRLNYICSARELLVSWARAFAEDYDLRLPANDMRAIGAWLRVCWELHAHSHVAVVDIADEWRNAAREGRRLTGQTEQGSLVPCQSPDGLDICGKMLRVDVAELEQRVVCRRCKTEWTGARLLSVAMDDRDPFLDAEAVTHIYMVPSRTLRHLAATGRVRRSHGRYAVTDVRAYLTDRTLAVV